MVKRRVRAIFLIACLVVVVTVLLKHVTVQPTERGPIAPGSEIARAHSSFPGPVPSKGNANPALKNEIQHLRQVVTKDSTNPATALELAQLLQDSHNPVEAAEYYALALRKGPGNTGARTDYALCLYELGRPGEALAQCMLVLREDSTNVEGLFNTGAIYANGGLTDSATVYWTKLIASHPDHALASRARENIEKLHGRPSGQ